VVSLWFDKLTTGRTTSRKQPYCCWNLASAVSFSRPELESRAAERTPRRAVALHGREIRSDTAERLPVYVVYSVGAFSFGSPMCST
jgi:hypothetical protein